MAHQEFTPETIGQSIAHIEDICRYVKGERVLPLQDPVLEQRYVDTVARQALTDPGIMGFLQRSRVGAWRGKGAPYLVVLEDGVHFISSGSYLRGDFDNITCLITGSDPRLVYATQTRLNLRWDAEEIREDAMKQKIAKWQNDVKEVCESNDGHSDWVFRHGYVNEYKDYLYLYAYRTMGASDLLFSGNLPTFVGGIGRTFALLKRSAEEESAVRFNGVQDIARIKSITEAFNKANEILAKVFNPDSSASTQPSVLQGRRTRAKGSTLPTNP